MTTELTQPTLSAGQILRQAREQQNLTVADVAQQLNLGKSLIDDLELDQVDAKLSSTFVRGYLRSYAKLLKIPAQQILDAYSSNSKGLHQVPSLTRSFSKRTAKEATENRFMWVTYFVIAVFVVLLVLGFWQSRFGGSGSGTALPMAQTDETMLASEDAQAVEAQQYQSVEQTQTENSIPVTQLEQSSIASDRPTLPTAAEPSLTTDVPAVLPSQQDVITTATAPETATSVNSGSTSADNSAVVTTPVQNEVQAQPSVPAATTPVQNDVQPSAAMTNEVPVVVTNNTAVEPVANAAVETATTEATDAAANAAINLTLNAECWVDIVDATGKRLVFGSRQAGEQLNLRGVAPVKVLLGNAAAATLSFNGEAIDLSGYPTGRVARLTLGQN
jgi:cytoskeleton protein RodZ